MAGSTRGTLGGLLRLALAVIALTASGVHADLRLPPIFSNHMVLQQKARVPIWGTASPGQTITVTLDKLKTQTTAGSDGRWMATFNNLKATPLNKGIELRVASGGKTVRVTNVAVGEVWVGSGQSNMQLEMEFADCSTPEADIKNSNNRNIRLLVVPESSSATLARDWDTNDNALSTWAVASPDSVRDFSRIGYYFARKLQPLRKVTVGVIIAAVGGTAIDQWSPTTDLSKQDVIAGADAQGSGNLFAGMIAPIMPYAIRGALWNQGETDLAAAYEYRFSLKNLISTWRRLWNAGTFAFIVVQLPPNGNGLGSYPGQADWWAPMRESQAFQTKALPNCGYVVTLDTGEGTSWHQCNKKPVGERAAFVAQKIAYGVKNVPISASFKSLYVKGNKAYVKLYITSPLKRSNVNLADFSVRGADDTIVWARHVRVVADDTVEVWDESVKAPVAVRYAWDNCPSATLWDLKGLPAAPFRSDPNNN